MALDWDGLWGCGIGKGDCVVANVEVAGGDWVSEASAFLFLRSCLTMGFVPFVPSSDSDVATEVGELFTGSSVLSTLASGEFPHVAQLLGLPGSSVTLAIICGSSGQSCERLFSKILMI